MAKTICKVLGVVFLIVGLLGFVEPRLLGMHLSPTHNVIHLVSAALALYFGFAASYYNENFITSAFLLEVG